MSFAWNNKAEMGPTTVMPQFGDVAPVIPSSAPQSMATAMPYVAAAVLGLVLALLVPGKGGR